MTRTKISFGHKQLVGGVVRSRRREAGGQGFEHQWLRSVKNHVTCDCPVGPLLVLKNPIFSAGFTSASVYKNWQ